MRPPVARRLALAAAIALVAPRASAEQLPLKSYTTADGLPSDRVHCILSDSRGFLWMGTEDGLSRFDGYGFRNIGTADGLPSSSVRAIAESRRVSGVYWIATSSGLVRLDANREPDPRGPAMRVVHAAAGGAAESILALLEDRAGTLWVGTEAGLHRLAGDGSLQAVDLGAESPPRNPVNALAEDRSGNLWIGLEGGLLRRSPDGTVRRTGSDSETFGVRCLLLDRAGRLWAGTPRDGLVSIEVEASGPGEALARPAFSARNGLAGDHVTDLLETADGTLWASCYGGVSEIARDRASLRSYTTAEGLSGFGVWSLAEDRDGDLWIGSDDAGLMRLARNGFRQFDARDGLRSTRIGSLFTARDGAVCAFTRGRRREDVLAGDGQIECWDGRRFSAQRAAVPPGTLLGWGWSQIAFQDHVGEWWLPTLNGLYRYPAASFSRLGSAAPTVYGTSDGLPDPRLFRLYEDRRGDVWIGVIGDRGNLARWERATNRIRAFSRADGVPGRQPMAFAEDRDGALWIGLRDGGLLRWLDGRMRLFETADGLPAGSVRALLCDGRGRLWLATSRSGVARVDRPEDDRPRFERFGAAQGLSSENTSSLVEDRSGRVYVGTERGLDRIDPETRMVERFTSDDGLARGVVETSLRDRDGDLWFGSVEGLSRLEPAAEARTPPPPVLVSTVHVNGVRRPLPELGATSLRLARGVVEPASVQIDFVSPDFAPGGRPRYQYRVDGLDRDWSAPTVERSVVYAHLPAGDYRFRVRGIAADGRVGPAEAAVVFAVSPSFWKRPEVAAVLALAAAAVAYALHRSRLRRVVAVERVRTRVAKDLHDDVGAGLSEIAILSEVAAHGNGRPPQSETALREIGDAARRLVDSMSDIVWSTDPRQDEAASLVARIRHFAANTLESRQIGWSLDVPPQFESRSLDAETRRQMLLIVKEALTNVARHSACTRASVRIVPEAHEVSIEVDDDGRGFSSPDGNAGGHGLGNMQARAASLGGSFRLDSRPGAGTRVHVRIPLARRGARGRSA